MHLIRVYLSSYTDSLFQQQLGPIPGAQPLQGLPPGSAPQQFGPPPGGFGGPPPGFRGPPPQNVGKEGLQISTLFMRSSEVEETSSYLTNMYSKNQYM